MSVALITNAVAGLLTLFVLSRIIRDNPLFRVAQYLFVGVSLGYAFVVLYYQVLVPDIFNIVAALDNPPALVLFLTPFVLFLLFLPRVLPGQVGSWLANIPLGIIFGVGAALSLFGALMGTLLPQVVATIPVSTSGLVPVLGGLLLALGVVATLSYFYFTVPQDTRAGRFIAVGAQVGRWLLMIAFGVFFGSALITYLTALSDRFDFLVGWLT